MKNLYKKFTKEFLFFVFYIFGSFYIFFVIAKSGYLVDMGFIGSFTVNQFTAILIRGIAFLMLGQYCYYLYVMFIKKKIIWLPMF